jgi:hypothetical protein
LRPLVVTVLSASVLAACSKSPVDSTVDAANTAATKLMAPLVHKDASRQVEGLIRTIDQRPECARYIQSLREAGHESPYEGATQWAIAHTYDAAGKAGCVNKNGDNGHR